MKACSYCGQDVKDSCTVCPKCKRPITAPDAEVFPELRGSRKKKNINEDKAQAERMAQAALAPDDPEAELLKIQNDQKSVLRERRRLAAVAYTGLLFFIPLYACKDKEYAKFHANQGLVILILLLIGTILSGAVGNTRIGYTICCGYFGGLFYLMILGAIRGFQGRTEELPIIGGIKLIRSNINQKR